MLKQILLSSLLSISILVQNVTPVTEADLREEIRLGQMELLAQLCMAEAGNQGLDGMRYVADVVLNRVDDPRFPDTVEEVIYQTGQFAVMKNGAFEEAGWTISEDAFKASEMEWDKKNRLDQNILYFNNKPIKQKHVFRYKGHWFGY